MRKFVDMGISNFIFANHSLRTVVTALQKNLKLLHDSLDLMSIEKEIVPVKEVFRLQNVAELKTMEERYLPSSGQSEPRAIVLAATKGDFGDLVRDKPKAMLPLHGRPILAWHADAFRRQGIRHIAAVRGYKKEAVDLVDLQYFDNDDYAASGELASLYAARSFLEGDLVIAYGDILFDEFILRSLLSHPGDINIAVDVGWKLRGRKDIRRDLVITSGTNDPVHPGGVRLEMIGAVPEPQSSGEWIGLLYLRAPKTAEVVRRLDAMAKSDPERLQKGGIPALLNELVAAGETVNVVHTWGHWHDLDEERDLLFASGSVS
jgi:phosphoenolpyruvate phosphomutase